MAEDRRFQVRLTEEAWDRLQAELGATGEDPRAWVERVLQERAEPPQSNGGKASAEPPAPAPAAQVSFIGGAEDAYRYGHRLLGVLRGMELIAEVEEGQETLAPEALLRCGKWLLAVALARHPLLRSQVRLTTGEIKQASEALEAVRAERTAAPQAIPLMPEVADTEGVDALAAVATLEAFGARADVSELSERAGELRDEIADLEKHLARLRDGLGTRERLARKAEGEAKAAQAVAEEERQALAGEARQVAGDRTKAQAMWSVIRGLARHPGFMRAAAYLRLAAGDDHQAKKSADDLLRLAEAAGNPLSTEDAEATWADALNPVAAGTRWAGLAGQRLREAEESEARGTAAVRTAQATAAEAERGRQDIAEAAGELATVAQSQNDEAARLGRVRSAIETAARSKAFAAGVSAVRDAAQTPEERQAAADLVGLCEAVGNPVPEPELEAVGGR